MSSRLSVWAARLVESTWLTAVVVSPAFFNVYSRESFEPDKVFLLRSLAAVTLAAAVVWRIAEGRGAWTVGGGSVWNVPLVRPVCALTIVYTLATSCSIAPSISLWGSYARAQGLGTWLSYIVVFLATLLITRPPASIERLVSVLLLASVAPALYGIMQRFGRDPIGWVDPFTERVTSTVGNPIFLGAFLLMVVPLTLARLIEALVPAAPVAALQSRIGRVAPYAALLVLQVMAIYFAQSRGPTVGLVCGGAAFGLLVALRARLRWPLVVVSVGAGLVLLVGVALPGGGVLGRAGQIFAWQDASARARVLIWQGVTELLARNPGRAIVGHGPETMMLAFNPVYPSALPVVALDRAHNDTLESLVTIGVAGCAAQILLFVSFFTCVLRRLGVISTPGQRNGFWAVVAAGAIGGALAPYAMTRGFNFSGLGLSLGLAVAVLAYLATLALWRVPSGVHALDDESRLLAALFAGVMGHFVEVQVGIATSVTRLYFFVFAGLAVALGLRASRSGTVRERPGGDGLGPFVIGAVTALILIAMTFDFHTPTTDLRTHGPTLVGAFLILWLIGAALAFEDVSRQSPATLYWLRVLGRYAAASIGPWLLFAVVLEPWITWPRTREAAGASVQTLGRHLSDTVTVLYGALFLGALGIAARLAWGASVRPLRATRWWVDICAVSLLGAASVVVFANLQTSQADGWRKLGDTFEREGRASDAVAAHEEALRRWPTQQEYAINLARALIQRARLAADHQPRQGDADAARAIHLMQATAWANPLNPDHPTNLARLYRKWARFGDPGERRPRLDHAEAAFQQALAAWPNNLLLRDELALLYAERGQADVALQTFSETLRRNDQFLDAYVRRAQLFVALQRFDDAAADYRRARQVCGADATRRAGLVRLYTQTKQTDRALSEARAARAQTPDALAALDLLINELERAQSLPPTH